MSVRRIGLAFNPTDDAAIALRQRAEAWCEAAAIGHWASPAGDLEALTRELPGSDVLVVLGGDGTFLRAALAVARVDVPLLGVNRGKVGFLSKAEAQELEPVLIQLASGDFTVGERMGLTGAILRGGLAADEEPFTALNGGLEPVPARSHPATGEPRIGFRFTRTAVHPR